MDDSQNYLRWPSYMWQVQLFTYSFVLHKFEFLAEWDATTDFCTYSHLSQWIKNKNMTLLQVYDFLWKVICSGNVVLATVCMVEYGNFACSLNSRKFVYSPLIQKLYIVAVFVSQILSTFFSIAILIFKALTRTTAKSPTVTLRNINFVFWDVCMNYITPLVELCNKFNPFAKLG